MVKRKAWTVAYGVGLCSIAALHGQQPPPHGDRPPQHMEHRFDDVERYAREFDNPARDAWQMPGRVIDALAIEPGDIVADIGAGTGYFTVRLARHPAKPTVVAADIEPAMVSYLRHRATKEGLANVVAVQAAPDRANLPEPVDLVLVVDTYHHIANREVYFAALQRSMKPGARLAVIDFRQDAPDGPPAHLRFPPEQIIGELAKAGFRLQTRHEFLPRQIFLVFTAT